MEGAVWRFILEDGGGSPAAGAAPRPATSQPGAEPRRPSTEADPRRAEQFNPASTRTPSQERAQRNDSADAFREVLRNFGELPVFGRFVRAAESIVEPLLRTMSSQEALRKSVEGLASKADPKRAERAAQEAPTVRIVRTEARDDRPPIQTPTAPRGPSVIITPPPRPTAPPLQIMERRQAPVIELPEFRGRTIDVPSRPSIEPPQPVRPNRGNAPPLPPSPPPRALVPVLQPIGPRALAPLAQTGGAIGRVAPMVIPAASQGAAGAGAAAGLAGLVTPLAILSAGAIAAGAALKLATEAVKAFDAAALQRAGELTAFSADLARAQAMNNIRRLQADQAAARQIGGRLADYSETRNQLDLALQRFRDSFIGALLDRFNGPLEGLVKLVDIASENGPAVQQGLGLVLDAILAMNPNLKALVDAGNHANRLLGENKKDTIDGANDILGIFGVNEKPLSVNWGGKTFTDNSGQAIDDAETDKPAPLMAFG